MIYINYQQYMIMYSLGFAHLCLERLFEVAMAESWLSRHSFTVVNMKKITLADSNNATGP